MLFNSYEFIFAFLPLTLAGYLVLRSWSLDRAGIAWLTLASALFYAWWSPYYLALFGLLIVLNYLLGYLVSRPEDATLRRCWLIAGVALNLSVLGYYKYTNFFIANLNDLTSTRFAFAAIVLPLGISFFTFQKIAYLADCFKDRRNETSLLDFSLFVMFFPQLIAGPIVHHKMILPQFKERQVDYSIAHHVAAGLTLFLIGLFKKAVLADGSAVFATPMFTAASKNVVLSAQEAWGGALAYTFQLYFDFSGYSDMAIGLAFMFGIRLPENFNSPYKAASIIDFWRRWHITLSTFLRDYLYIPLGGNRKGAARRYLNVFVTMVIGGLWHGANWTFVIWGALHGSYLIVNHVWRMTGLRLPAPTSVAATFLCVVVGWVYFRSADITTAHAILASMIGMNGWSGANAYLYAGEHVWIAALATFCLLMPNSNELVAGLAQRPDDRRIWQPDLRWAIIMPLVAAISVIAINRNSEFLYFNF